MWKDKEWYIDGFLASQLNSIVYNITSDWDFVILISGDRTVRVGKSVLALTVCAYLASLIEKNNLNKEPYTIDDIYFDNKEMIKAALNKPAYSINHYDEGREGLAASKAMKQFQQDLLDFFAECGQLRHIFVIVLPDFFELKEEIAVARSEFLLNVYRKEEKRMVDMHKTGEKMPVVKLMRGFFEFFSRRKKVILFDKARSTRRKSYGLIKADFVAKFVNQYPVDEEEYKKRKQDALKRFIERHKEEKEKKDELTPKQQILLDAIRAHEQKTISKIAKDSGLSHDTPRKLKLNWEKKGGVEV
jgi:hypothetical protein